MAKIIVYSADWCPYCTDVKNYLDSRNATYEVHDVDKNPTALAEMLRLNNGKTYLPTININGQIIHGFNREEIDRELDNIASK